VGRTFKILSTFAVIILLASCRDQRARIAYVNSYHEGYKPSDEIRKGIDQNLPAEKYALKIFYIDSKRNTDTGYLSAKIDTIHREVMDFKPEVLIVSDDYAVNWLIKPFFNPSEIPVVFCGVNWSAEKYNLKRENITGMLEVVPLHNALSFTKANLVVSGKIAVVSENSLSEQSNTALLDTLYKNCGFEPLYLLADDFESWKKNFLRACEEADIIYLPTNGAIKNWDENEAVKFVTENIRKPVFTCDDFMMEYCVFGFTKVPIEQGIYAAETAKRILNGTSPAQIPYSRNIQAETWFNPELAEKVKFKPDSNWLKTAKLKIKK